MTRKQDIIDGIITAYEDFLPMDNFPLNTNEFQVLELWREEAHAIVGNKSNFIRYWKNLSSKIKICRINPIQAANNIGKLNFCITTKALNEIKYETCRDETNYLLQEMERNKSGILGEIIKAMCNKIIILDESVKIFSFKIIVNIELRDSNANNYSAKLVYQWLDEEDDAIEKREDIFIGTGKDFQKMPSGEMITPESLEDYSSFYEENMLI